MAELKKCETIEHVENESNASEMALFGTFNSPNGQLRCPSLSRFHNVLIHGQ